MKKVFKIAGAVAGVAALASLVPYSFRKDQEKDEISIQALLWKYTSQPDPESPCRRKLSIDIGFHNPFAVENDDLLMDEEEDLILVKAPVEAAPQCDIELTLEPKLDDEEPEALAQPEATPADYEPEVY